MTFAGFRSDVIALEKQGSVGTLWLDRPEKRNALSRELWGNLPRALEALRNDPEVRAVVLAGRGSSFCVGIDLADLGGSGGDPEAGSPAQANIRQIEFTRRFQAAVSAFEACPLPVIAAVQGHCLGGGVDLITAADIRLASRDASFGVRETRIGIVADVGTLQRLPRVVSAGHVAELVYTGRDIDAARAERIGLVNEVYSDSLHAAALELAAEIAANPPLAVQGTKFVLQQSEGLSTEQSLLLNALWTMTTTLNSDDLREAMAAFREKRPGVFTGR